MIKIQKRLSVLLVWLRRKWEKINCRLSLISLLIHIFPIKLRNRLCRVIIFWPSPLQWICREWVKKLGSDEATTCFEGEKYTESDNPTYQGERAPCPKTRTPNSPRIPGASLIFLGILVPPPALGDLCYFIPFSFVHPLPTLVSHPCPYSSARPIGHSFWRFVSCCGTHRTVQGSHPHQWDQGVSCEYLIRRW